MPKNRKYLSLAGASQARSTHDKDTRLPNVETLKNLVPGLDGCPSLRDDLTYDTNRLMTCVNVGADGLYATDSNEYMSAIVEARNGQTCWFSRHFAFQTTGGTATVKNSTYTTGTVTAVLDDATIVGSGTAFLRNVWPGCLLVMTGDAGVYMVKSVTDDTNLELEIESYSDLAGVAYTIYQVPYGNDAKWPHNVQQWGDKLVYNVEKPEPPVVEANVSGPFTNSVSQGSSYGTWVQKGNLGSHNLFCWGNGFIVAGGTESSAVWYASDTGSVWTVSTGLSRPSSMCYSSSLGVFVAMSLGLTYKDTDGTGATWSVTAATEIDDATGCVIAEDGAGRFVVAGGYDVSYYSDDITGDWTQVTGFPYFSPRSMVFETSNFIAVGMNGGIATSPAGEDATWTTRTSGTTAQLKSVCGDGSGNAVAVGSGGMILLSGDSGVTWTQKSVPSGYESCDFLNVVYSGSYWVVSGDNSGSDKVVIKSSDGTTWEAIDISGCPDVSLYGSEIVIPGASDLSTITVLVGGAYAYYGTVVTPSGTEFGTFSPLSTSFRSKAFTVAGSYLMLGGMTEWNTSTSTWVYYPRRIRWPSPGTVNDFDGEGGSWLDLPGVGEVLMLRTIGTNVVGWDTSGIFVLEQTGDLDAPWGYRRLRDGVQAISNSVQVGSQVFWIAHDGRLWATNGVQVDPSGSFDLGEFDDWQINEGYSTWMAWYPALNCLCVMKITNSGTDNKLWLISSDQRICYIAAPSWVDSAANRYPLSMFVSRVGNDPRLYIGYDANKNVDTNHLVSAYFQKGDHIHGVDHITSVITSSWSSILETGYDRLTDEGSLVMIHSLELYGYCEYTQRTLGNKQLTYGPHIGIQMKTQDETNWYCPGSTAGTITVTDAACTGSGTAFSNLVAAGDDASTVFTIPGLAANARVFLEDAGVYTLQVKDTDYTVTDTKEITLGAALVSGINLYVYWDAEPLVKTEVGDLILTSSMAHRAVTIPTATTMTLDQYLASGTATGTHVPAERMDDGDGSTVHGMGHRGDIVKFRMSILPQNQTYSPSSVRITGMMIEYTPLESTEQRKD